MLINTTTFQGEYPRIANQLLPENAAQSAIDCRFLSGTLDSWHDKTLIADAICKMGTINTVYLMDDQYWLQWTTAELGSGQTNVDVARGPIEQDTTERTIFTGTDVPRITNIDKATGDSGCYPQDSLKLGVPAPTVAPTLVVNAADVAENQIVLTNEDAESGNTSGWTTTGDFTAYDNNDIVGLVPHGGNFYFGGGSAATTTAYQQFDVTTAGTSVGQVLTLSWWQASGPNNSTALMELVFFDSSPAEIGRISGTNQAVNPDYTWAQYSISGAIPMNTESVRVLATFTKVGGGINDAFIDDIDLLVTDSSYSSDGSDLLNWQRLPDTGGNPGARTVSVFDAGGSNGNVFRFFADENTNAIYRDFSLGNTAAFTISYDINFAHLRNEHHLVIGGTSSGVGQGITLPAFESPKQVQRRDFSSHVDRGSAGIEISPASIPVNDWIHIEVVGSKSSPTTAACVLNATRVSNGQVLVADDEFTITLYGDFISFKHWSNEGGGTAVTLVDNININTTPSFSQEDGSSVFTSYVYTYINEFGQESAPSPVSRIVQFPDGGSITVTMDDTFDADYGVEAIRLYRAVTAAGSTDFQLVNTDADITTDTYVDDNMDADLGEVLQTVDWDLPPTDGSGVLALPNGVTAMFSKNQFCPSVINQCHAYPIPYRLNFESDIVAHAAIDTSVVIGTETYPYMVLGSDPSQMSSTKFEQRQACVSKQSMVSIRNYGVVYASPDGLVAINGAGGLSLVTDAYFSREEWQALSPSSIVAYVHDDRYYGFYDNGTPGGFVFDPRQGGNGLTFLSEVFTAGYSDPKTDTLYLVADDGELYAWDDLAAAKIPYDWRGKLHRLPRAGNFRAFQVRADSYTNLTFRFYSNGTLLHTQTVTSEAEKVMPPNTSTRLEMRITGTDRLWQLQVAEEVEELQ